MGVEQWALKNHILWEDDQEQRQKKLSLGLFFLEGGNDSRDFDLLRTFKQWQKLEPLPFPRTMKNPLSILPGVLATNFLMRYSNSLDLSFPFHKVENNEASNNQMRPMDIQAPDSCTQNSVFIRLPLLLSCSLLCSSLSLSRCLFAS